MSISIETAVKVPLPAVWQAWVTPEDIIKWHYAIDTWHCPRATIDLAVNGAFNYRMEARDGSMGFNFAGVFNQDRSRQIH